MLHQIILWTWELNKFIRSLCFQNSFSNPQLTQGSPTTKSLQRTFPQQSGSLPCRTVHGGAQREQLWITSTWGCVSCCLAAGEPVVRGQSVQELAVTSVLLKDREKHLLHLSPQVAPHALQSKSVKHHGVRCCVEGWRGVEILQVEKKKFCLSENAMESG